MSYDLDPLLKKHFNRKRVERHQEIGFKNEKERQKYRKQLNTVYKLNRELEDQWAAEHSRRQEEADLKLFEELDKKKKKR